MEIDKQGNAAIAFRLDPASGVPPYQQLVRQVEGALRLGYLAPGDQLPNLDVVPLRNLHALRRKLVRWLADAEEAGLDDESVSALISSARHESRSSKRMTS